MLTGCEAEDYFGATGQYVLRLGEDVFGTGHQGVTGGESPTDPQSNDETHIFQNYDVKKVEKAPKEEKVAYNFSGPENKGITPSQPPVAATVAPNKPAENIDPGTTVVITAGHCAAEQNKPEPFAKQCYKYIVQKLLETCGSLDKDHSSFACGPLELNKDAKAIYKIAKGKAAPAGKDGVKAFYDLTNSYGFTKSTRSGHGVPACDLSDKKFYKEYGKKVDKFLNKLADASSRPAWVAASTSSSTGPKPASDKNPNGKFFKFRALGGASYKGTAEHTLNYRVAKELQKQLVKKGYNVVLGRLNDNTNKLADGTAFSNKNMSVFAKKQKAIVHFVIHWDSSASGYGMHTYTSSANYASKSVVETSEKVANAMYKKRKLLFHNKNTANSHTYTTLNWADVPTVIVECGYLNNKDFGKFDAHKALWVMVRLGAFIAGIEAAEGSAD